MKWKISQHVTLQNESSKKYKSDKYVLRFFVSYIAMCCKIEEEIVQNILKSRKIQKGFCFY